MLCYGEISSVSVVWALSDDEIAQTLEAVSELEFPSVVSRTMLYSSGELPDCQLPESEKQ